MTTALAIDPFQWVIDMAGCEPLEPDEEGTSSYEGNGEICEKDANEFFPVLYGLEYFENGDITLNVQASGGWMLETYCEADRETVNLFVTIGCMDFGHTYLVNAEILWEDDGEAAEPEGTINVMGLITLEAGVGVRVEVNLTGPSNPDRPIGGAMMVVDFIRQ